MFLNFNPTTDFPVSLDHVYKDLGFANKGNAMKTIKSNFTKEEDYKILLVPTEKQQSTKDLNVCPEETNEVITNKSNEDCLLVPTEKQTNRGGHNHETIMLNIDTYKTLCMLVKTPQGKEIRKYYVKLENIYNKIIKEEIESQKLLLEKKEVELEYTKRELQKKSVSKIKKWYDSEPGDTVYVVKLDCGLIKLGKSKKVSNREKHYTNDNIGDMIYIKKCYNCDLTEKVLHHILDKHRIESNREWFDISNELAIYTIDIVCDFMDKFINFSEELPKSNIKENLNISLEIVKNLSNEIKEIIKTENIEIKEPILNKIVNIESNEDVIKKFIDEYCELDESYYVLSYEILGAYRLWSRGFNLKDRTYFTQYMKKHFTSKKK